ncbi:dual specificity protein kinase splA-like isoform X1 [Argonauta hians]
MTSGRSANNNNNNNNNSNNNNNNHNNTRNSIGHHNSMAATTSGISVGQDVVIYEDHLYKLRTMSGLRTFSINYKPWRLKYFMLKKKDDNLLLEYYDRQPALKRNPKMQLLLNKYRVEKITNSKNRAYVFEITTPERRLCLSANEQRTMDMFVFFLQIQRKLIRELTEDYIVVQPENSETLRRIGAKGCPCVLYISPSGVTLALQGSLRVLAQWPLKSIRCYESSCQGQFSLEAGRVAPMGDGLYIFNTQPGDDDRLYDLLDKHVINALQKIRPGQEISHQIEEYGIETKQLQCLTQFSLCTQYQEEIPRILQENWNLILPSFDLSRRPSSSITVPGRPPPTRPDFLANFSSSSPLPPPLPIRSVNTTSTEVLTSSPDAFVPDFRSLRLKSANGVAGEAPLESSSLDTSNHSVPDFVSSGRSGYMYPNHPLHHPMLRHSQSLSSPEPDSLLNVFSESSPDNNEGYLTACLKKRNNTSITATTTTGSDSEWGHNTTTTTTSSNSDSNNLNKPHNNNNNNSLRRRSRLKSRSCEDLNSYIKMSALKTPSNDGTTTTTMTVVPDGKMEDKRDNTEEEEDEEGKGGGTKNNNNNNNNSSSGGSGITFISSSSKYHKSPPVPFPRLQNLRSSLYCDSNGVNTYRTASVYYGNISRQKNGVYEPANPGVSELRQIFDTARGGEGLKKMRKSVSNPNFFNISSKDNSVCPMAFASDDPSDPDPGTSPLRLAAGNKNKSTHKSWRNLFTDRRRRSNHDSHHQYHQHQHHQHQQQQHSSQNQNKNNNNNNSNNHNKNNSSSSSQPPLAAEEGPYLNEAVLSRPAPPKGRSSSFSKKSSSSHNSSGSTSSQLTDTYGTGGMRGVRMTPKTRSYRRLRSESTPSATTPTAAACNGGGSGGKSKLKEATPPLASVESLC